MYKIPTNYEALFRDRLLIITGVGRSGTSILGKLIGSMTPVYYLYEPAICKYMAFDDSHGAECKHMDEAFRAILFEDYFLPLVQGRALNKNENDDSFFGNYTDEVEILRAQRSLPQRSGALKFVQETNPLFVIKTNEAQPAFERYRRVFPGVRFIHIIRNGNDVVAGTVKKGWYTDDHMAGIVDWVEDIGLVNAPWYLDREEKLEKWTNWNQTTRAACVWRTLIDFAQSDYGITYEGLLYMPGHICMMVNVWYPHIKKTRITDRHIDAVLKHKPTKYPAVINDIQEPEREKFKALMGELGYL